MPSGVYQRKKGENSCFWKGEKANYRSIHTWVTLQKGKAKKCSQCGKTGDRIHWANIDHKYRRNLEDYIEWCASCHKIHDLKNGLVKH